MMIRRSAACRCVRTSWSVFKLNQTCFVESSLVMRHGFFLVRPGNQAPEMSVEVPDVAEAEESKTVKIKSQSRVDHVLRYTASSCHRARRSISKSTKRSCGFCIAQCARRDESCGRTNRGCFTTTVHLLTTP